jgi:glutamyl-tRNA synthetase
VESAVRGTASDRSIKAGALIHGVRVALTGRTASPGLFEMIVLLGREETIARLNALLTFLAARK